MAEAVEAISSAVRAGGTIMVHGDYDVDGQCATAVLTRALRAAGADVVPFVPHRLRDGYDFGPAGLAAARAAGASLVVTCDCGITAVDTVRDARAAGIGVVRHRPPPPGRRAAPGARHRRPPACRTTYPGCSHLCGTGIAFKLVQALVPALGLPANLPYYLLDMVALATVADVVPLQGENRILVKHGLRLLGESNWPGAARAGRGLRAAAAARSARDTWASSSAPGSTRPAGSATPPTACGCCSATTWTRPARSPGGSTGSTSSGRRWTSGSSTRRWRRSRGPTWSASRASCSRATAGIPAWSASSRRAWWSATAGPRS